jgi:L,D-transpeptidase YbiS
VVITVDVSTNHAYLFRDGQLVAKSDAATGSEKELDHGDDMWIFHTPRGHLTVKGKIKDPIWHKPDWAFIEEGKPVPPQNSPERDVKGKLGKYALSLGDGILIHGTDDPSSIGKRVSHGCIRVPDEMIEKLYNAAKVGTDVYIFDSQKPAAEAPASDLR